jgi:hypothetical protein
VENKTWSAAFRQLGTLVDAQASWRAPALREACGAEAGLLCQATRPAHSRLWRRLESLRTQETFPCVWSTFREHEPMLVDPITPEPRWMLVHTHRLGQLEAERRTRKYAGFIGDLLVVYPRFRQR